MSLAFFYYDVWVDADELTMLDLMDLRMSIQISGMKSIIYKENRWGRLRCVTIHHGNAGYTDLGIVCPRCGAEMKVSSKSVYCPEKDGGCGLSVWRTVAGKHLSEGTMRRLIRNGRTGVIGGLHGRKGEFSVALRLDEEYRVVFDFGENDRKKHNNQ